VRGDALGGFGAVVFFDQLQVDVGSGVIAVIEFAAVDGEELEGLVEVGFGELVHWYGMIKSSSVP
jgi:hypothetical protein